VDMQNALAKRSEEGVETASEQSQGNTNWAK